jgi:hypothetical protein
VQHPGPLPVGVSVQTPPSALQVPLLHSTVQSESWLHPADDGAQSCEPMSQLKVTALPVPFGVVQSVLSLHVVNAGELTATGATVDVLQPGSSKSESDATYTRRNICRPASVSRSPTR